MVYYESDSLIFYWDDFHEIPLTSRKKDLRSKVITLLRANKNLVDKLEEYDNIDNGMACIIPSFISDRVKKDIIISVNIISQISNRNNRHELKDFVVQVEARLEKRVIRTTGISYADDILDIIDDILTRHYEGWRTGGLSGSMELGWDDQRNIYSGARRYDYSTMDLRK